MTRLFLLAPAALAVAVTAVSPARAADNAPDPADMKAVVEKGYDALKGKQNADGSWGPPVIGPGITAIATAGLLRAGYGVDDAVVSKALKYLEGRAKPDGGVYDVRLSNYNTCLAIMTFKEANKDGKYDKVLAKAADFLRGIQSGSDDPKGVGYGGTGYDGKSGRGDLSNSHFFVEGLIAAGAGKDDPAVKKSLAFINRCQNLPGDEFNDQPFAAKTSEDDKGGFTYNPLEATAAKSARKTAAGGLRSEGGMTYAGLKSFLYAGVGKDDPRVKAALGWIKRHYTVTENPGQKDSGLFYYYQTFAKAMAVAAPDGVIEDAKGVKHSWKKDLFEELKKRQKADGTWTNSNGAFMESSPELATAFALLALSYCK